MWSQKDSQKTASISKIRLPCVILTNLCSPLSLPPPWFGTATGRQQTGSEQKDKER